MLRATHQAPWPDLQIDRGRPGPGLLAHVLVSYFPAQKWRGWSVRENRAGRGKLPGRTDLASGAGVASKKPVDWGRRP